MLRLFSARLAKTVAKPGFEEEDDDAFLLYVPLFLSFPSLLLRILICVIPKILNGQIYLSDKMAAKMICKLVEGRPKIGASPISHLSDRELEVFLLLGQGHGTRRIAEKLHLSIKTIETYRAHIKEKLNLVSASELLQYAIQWAGSRSRV